MIMQMNKPQFLGILNKRLDMQAVYNVCVSYATEHDKELSPDLFNQVNGGLNVDKKTGQATRGHDLVMDVFNHSLEYFKRKFEIVTLTGRNNEIIKYY